PLRRIVSVSGIIASEPLQRYELTRRRGEQRRDLGVSREQSIMDLGPQRASLVDVGQSACFSLKWAALGAPAPDRLGVQHEHRAVLVPDDPLSRPDLDLAGLEPEPEPPLPELAEPVGAPRGTREQFESLVGRSVRRRAALRGVLRPRERADDVGLPSASPGPPEGLLVPQLEEVLE